MERKHIKPKSFKDPLYLFEVCINNLIFSNRIGDFLSHSEISSIVFGSGDAIFQSYLSIVTNNFRDYISRSKNTYKFNEELVKVHFPHFFNPQFSYPNPIEEIRNAIKHEKEASFKKRVGKIIKFSSVTEIGSSDPYVFFNLKLNVESDDLIKLYEGMKLKLALDKFRCTVTALSYDEQKDILTIRSRTPFYHEYRKSRKKRIIIDSGWILDKLDECLQNYPDQKLPIGKLLNGKWKPEVIELNQSFYTGILDKNQQKSLGKCLTNDITAIWGPPGTGKSTTIGYLILELFKRKEKTLVCSIANVAVDSILTNTLHAFEMFETNEKPINYRGGKILRVGYSNDDEVKDNEDIKTESNQTRIINYELKKIKKKLERDIINEEKKAKLVSAKLDLINELEREKKKIIESATIIFATASKIEVDSDLRSLKVDNIIIDEASMMAAPHLLAVARNANKRIIIAGDFRQLGPIVISQSALANKWLKTDLFQFFGIDHSLDEISHPALTMIVNQRRFHDSICKLINIPFYYSKLITKTQLKSLKLYKKPPEIDKTVIYHDLSNSKDFVTIRSKEQSRFNPYSANVVIEKILIPLITHPLKYKFSIAIISPYKGQINLYTRLLQEKIKNDDFLSRVKCGTVHSFQGSQADIVIFDMVDSKHEKIGRLYWQNMGERLINVTISRATSKLIFIGDIEAITEGQGYMNVSSKVRRVLKSIALEAVNI